MRTDRAIRSPLYCAVVLLAAFVRAGNAATTGFAYLKEAENAALTGKSWAQHDPASGGWSVSVQGHPITWTAITAAGTYRLLARVRAGYSKDHTLYVKPRMGYAATVDGAPQRLATVPGTLVYHGDEANFVWLTTEPLVLARGLHSVVLTGAPTYGKLDVLGLTEDSTFVPAAEPPFGEETPVDVALLADDEQRRTYRGYTVWTQHPEANVAPADRPDDIMGIGGLTLTAARNEYESANFIVTNWRDTALTLRLRVGELTRGAGGPRLSGQRFQSLHALPIPAFDGRWLSDPLPRSTSGVFSVPAGESRQAWLRLHTRGVEPGTYTGELALSPVDSSDRRLLRSLRFTVTIHPFRLPEEHPLLLFMNEYDVNVPGCREDLAAHCINLFQVCKIPGPGDAPDFTVHDAEVRRELEYASGIHFEHWWFRQSQEWKTPSGRRRWQRWAKTWATHLWDDLGLKPEQVWLHIFDEQHGAAVDDYVAARQLLEEVVPDVRDTVTVGSSTTFEEVRRMDPYVDLWSPFLGRLDNAEEVAFYQQTGKPVVPYVCAENKKVFDPYAYFRLFPWKIWQWGFHGCWIWTYLRGNAWNGREWDGGVVYPGQGEIVTSRRWEAFRDGLEDYLYLYLLRQRLEAGEAPAGSADLLRQAAEAVLAEPQDAGRAHTWRARLAEALSR